LKPFFCVQNEQDNKEENRKEVEEGSDRNGKLNFQKPANVFSTTTSKKESYLTA
jgi:hypothetical protein